MFVISASELSQENREQKTRLGVAVHTCEPSNWKAEAGGTGV